MAVAAVSEASDVELPIDSIMSSRVTKHRKAIREADYLGTDGWRPHVPTGSMEALHKGDVTWFTEPFEVASGLPSSGWSSTP